MGGVGKTQTAARYAHQHRDEFKAVLWVSAASREALVSGFAALAGLLNLPEAGAQDQAQAVAAQIGTVRELVSRGLSRLQAQRTIEIEGRTIVIRDLKGLERELEDSD